MGSNDAMQESLKKIETRYNELMGDIDCDLTIDLLSEELRMIKRSRQATFNDKFKIYKDLQSITTKEKMKKYLAKKRKFELHGIKSDNNNNNNYKDKNKIIAEWNWQQVSQWAQKTNEFSVMAGVFAEFRINGIELSTMTSEQMFILSKMSHYRSNMGHITSEKDFDKLRTKINQHRVANMLKILYQQIWDRTIEKADSIVTKQKMSKLDKITKNIGSRKHTSEINLARMQNIYAQKQPQPQQHNNTSSPTVVVLNSGSLSTSNVTNSMDEILSQQSIMTVAKQQEMATLCVEIAAKLRSDREKGMLRFWKEDAVFFDKIDNILAILMMPKTFGEIVKGYFAHYFSDSGDETKENTEENINPFEEKEEEDDEKYENKKRSKFVLNYLTTIREKMNEGLKREDYTYNYQKFGDCVTGAQIVSFIEQFTRTRKECLQIADSMLKKGWIEECRDDSIVNLSKSMQNNNNNNNDNYNNSNTVNHFKDRGTAFYKLLCDKSVNLNGQNRAASALARYKSSSALGDRISDSLDGLHKPIILLGFGIVLGCFVLLKWWFDHSSGIVSKAKDLTIESIEETTNLQIEIAFGIPQAILQFTIGYLLTRDIPTNESMLDAQYDSLLTVFDKYDPYNAVHGVYIYNENDDIIVGGYRNQLNSTIEIFKWTDDEFHELNLTLTNDTQFVPSTREWFKVATKLRNNSRIWTDLYDFWQGVVGISLVSTVYVDNKRFIVFLDYDTNGLKHLVSNIEIPLDGTLYITSDDANNYTVIISKGDNDSINSSQNESKQLIKQKLASSDGSNETKWSNDHATVSSFPMVWHSEQDQTGYIVIVYSKTPLDSLYPSLWRSIGIGVVFCVLSCIFAILVTKATSKFIDNVNSNKNARDKCGSMIEKGLKLSIKCLGRPHYSIKYLIIVCEISLCLTLAIIYITSYITTDSSFESFIDNIMVKEEHNKVQNRIMYLLTDNVDLIFGVMSSRMLRDDMGPHENLTYDTFFKNTMEAITDQNLAYQQYGMYLATPNGEFHGMFVLVLA